VQKSELLHSAPLRFLNSSVLQLQPGDAIALLNPPAFDALARLYQLAPFELTPGMRPLSTALQLGHNAAQLRYYALEGQWPTQAVVAFALAYAHIEMQGARLLQAELSLRLSDQHFEHICRLLREVLPTDVQLHAHSNQLLSLSVFGKYAEPPDAPWLDQALGSRLADALVQPLHWAKLQNDLQMELAQLPLQQAREQAGLAPVNCVWLWGANSLGPANTHAQFALCAHSKDPLLLAMQASSAQAKAVRTEIEQSKIELSKIELFDLRDQGQPNLPNSARLWLWCLDGRACMLQRSLFSRWFAKFKSARA
jgi:hypothetical protein